MIYFLKYDIPSICKKIIRQQMKNIGLDYQIISHTEIDIRDVISDDHLKYLNNCFHDEGVEIIETQKSILIQKIKDTIIELVNMEEKLSTVKTSDYLSNKLHHRYGYLSNVFSEVTYTTIENFMILQKIERAKDLINTNEYTFTEIAWKLNYSSMAHFSLQFKNTTGLTPSAFQRIMNKKRKYAIAA
jgi:AraC-like DNA-binding protein